MRLFAGKLGYYALRRGVDTGAMRRKHTRKYAGNHLSMYIEKTIISKG